MKLIYIFIILFSLNVKANTTGKFEIRTAPLAFYAKWVTLDATYILNKQWAVGPSYVSYADDSVYGNMFFPSYHGSAVGAHAIWTVDDLYSNSWYIGSHAYIENYRSRTHASPLGDEENRKGYRVNAILGFRQLSGSFLTMVGLGYETQSHQVESIKNGAASEFDRTTSWFTAEFKAGWVF